MKISLLRIFFLFVNFLTVFTARTGSKDKISKKFSLHFISKADECSDDIGRLCGNNKRSDDLTLLNCLQDNEDTMRALSGKCQHYLWQYKRNFTTNHYLDNVINEKCGTNLQVIKECITADIGYKIPCLMDHKTEITEKTCHNFLNKVGVFVFSDFDLTNKFIEKCKADIDLLKCGRISKSGASGSSESDDDNEMTNLAEYVTSQADTLDCLVTAVRNVSRTCQHEILRLSELQSDDFHLNRKLYMACREDRDNLCSNIISGEGRVYACLMKHKFSDKMSSQCQKQLTKKQQIEARDVKANYPLFSHCKADIDKHQCNIKTNLNGAEALEMSTVLLCLEEAESRGARIDPNCKAELTQRRIEMVEDYQVSPEVVVACNDDVNQYCNEHERGEVLHCLMQLAEPDEKHPKGKLNDHCRVALIQLLKVANPTEDVMLLDPTIRKICSSTFNTLCKDIGSKDQAFQCLVQNIASPEMSPDCRSQISSILYFVSYDFTIDSAVQQACHKDAMKLCNGPRNLKETQSRTEIERKLEYHCMFQQYKQDRINMDIALKSGAKNADFNTSLTTDCANEIFRVIKAQASQIKLDPIVFDKCVEDLGKYCVEMKHKGREHECLQENLDSLQPECQKAVIDFSQMEDADVRLNRHLSEACRPMVKEFCSKSLSNEMLPCLIQHKLNPGMIDSCRAAIEHFQITSLEEFRIDHRFAKFCEKEINNYCSDELKGYINGQEDNRNNVVSKAAIVSCLSRTVVNELVQGKKHPLSKMCREQFSFELLQRADSIKLDKYLQKDCKKDIETFCKSETPDKISTCLRKHQDDLQDACHRRIFRRERMESLDAKFDGRLKRVCSQMIEEYCHDEPGTKLFQCLHRRMNEASFDEDCRQLIFLRLERRMNDIRLNPGLMKDCEKEIHLYCSKEFNNKMEPANGIEYEGIVIQCLKDTFSNDSKKLQPVCRQRVLKIIIEANAHLRLDPQLRKKCMTVIKEHCNDELVNQFDMSVGSVHDCLKHQFLKNKIQVPECGHEVYRLLKEGKADVHVDRELYDACEEAIMKLCKSENFGEGRKMSCLLYFADDKKYSNVMNTKCLRLIKDRREMWSFAANIEPQSFQDIVLQINQSSMRTYLFSMLGLMIFALIILGICCGRITKRVPVDLKNK